jgi:hypothetical protein
LKKATKKLSLFPPNRQIKWANQELPLMCKSFLVLFFKKELLPLRQPSGVIRPTGHCTAAKY